MNRSRIATMVALLAAALVLGFAIIGQARERTTLFVPSQPIPGTNDGVPPGGATVSRTGTPFVLFIGDEGPISGGTCDFERFGSPGGNLVCDEPTTLFLGPPPDAEIDENVPLSAFVCNVPVENEAQPSSSPAPVTQEGDQESEAGEIDQSFEG